MWVFARGNEEDNSPGHRPQPYRDTNDKTPMHLNLTRSHHGIRAFSSLSPGSPITSFSAFRTWLRWLLKIRYSALRWLYRSASGQLKERTESPKISGYPEKRLDTVSTIVLQGTQGYGKTHVLAIHTCSATACKRTVCIPQRIRMLPKCFGLLEGSGRSVLLVTFADDREIIEEILEFQNMVQIKSFIGD